MALTKCRECGNRISKQAGSCPSCGSPLKKKPKVSMGCGCLLLLVAGVLATPFMGILISSFKPTRQSITNKPKQKQEQPKVKTEKPTQEKPKLVVKKQKEPDPPKETPIPNDVTYSIINDTDFLSYKRSLDILLNKKVSKDVLKTIAKKLIGTSLNRYDKIFIVYYLPGMTVDAGGWATSHFKPNLEVRIIGEPLKKQKVFRPTTTEKKARNALRAIKILIKKKKKADGIPHLERLVKKYPNTEAAKEARQLLEEK